MRWVDERIFGWSGSDRRRIPTSGATSPGLDSGAETDETDDDADYDQVINILHRHSGAGLETPGSPIRKAGGRPGNSRGQSYAELQTLKRTPLVTGAELPAVVDEQTPLLKQRKNSGIPTDEDTAK